MPRRKPFVAIAVLLLGFAALHAAGPNQVVRLKGYVVDEWCGKGNANPEGKACVLACAKKGAQLVFFTSEGETYKLGDREQALQHVGARVEVIGTVDEGLLHVGRWIALKDGDGGNDAGSGSSGDAGSGAEPGD